MGILSALVKIGAVVGGTIVTGKIVKKVKKDNAEREEETRRLEEESRRREEARLREEAREEARKNTPCIFSERLTQTDFENLAIGCARGIKRLIVSVEGQFVHGTVKTTSGISTWTFSLDFNDFGNITGNFWWVSHGNPESSIPNSYAQNLSTAIRNHLSS